MRAFCCSVPHNVEWDNYKRSDTCIAFAYQIASVSQQQRWGDLAPTSEISSLWISSIILHMLKHYNRHWVFDYETARHWHKHLGCNSRYNLRTRTQYSQLNLTWDSFESVLVLRKRWVFSIWNPGVAEAADLLPSRPILVPKGTSNFMVKWIDANSWALLYPPACKWHLRIHTTERQYCLRVGPRNPVGNSQEVSSPSH